MPYKDYEKHKEQARINSKITHNTGYRTSHTKNLDHDYLSKYPRFVCCHKCNHHLQKVDNMRYKVMLELHRYFKIHL